MNTNYSQMRIVERDDGLRAFFGKIYNYMAGSLVLSGFAAYLSIQEPLKSLLYVTKNNMITLAPLGWIVAIAPFILIFMIQNAVNKLNTAKANVYFWSFSALMGLSMGSIFMVYTTASIMQTFLITAGSFLALSVYGSTTKRDLSQFGSFLFMGLIGIILASVVNIFIASSMVSFCISVIGVFLFAGLIAYDTNRLKTMFYTVEGHAEMQKSLAISGALSLYLNFINLFQFLLSFLGNRE